MADPNCPGCRSIYEIYSAPVYVDDLETLVDKKQPRNLFFEYVSGLQNEKGGAIVIHANRRQLLEKFDQKVDNFLNCLISDGSMYHDVYDRCYYDSKHLVYRVKPSAQNKPRCTMNFNNITPHNKGRAEPTYLQLQTLIEKLCREKPPVPNTASLAAELKIPLEDQTPVSVQRDYGDEPFQEGVNIQAKAVQPQPGRKVPKLVDYCWKDLKVREYISAFTKLKGGGVVYLGVAEGKTASDEWKPASPADCSNVVQLAGTSHADGWRLWKHRDENRPKTVFYVAKQDAVPRKETTTGEFKTEAIKLNQQERQQFREGMLEKVGTELKWAGTVAPHDHIVQVRFHDVHTPNGSATQPPTARMVQTLAGSPSGQHHPAGVRHQGAALPEQQPNSSAQQASTPFVEQQAPTMQQATAMQGTAALMMNELCVIEIRIGYYHGICFYDKEGPLSYRCRFQKAGGPFPKPCLEKIGFAEWVDSFTEKASEKIKDKF